MLKFSPPHMMLLAAALGSMLVASCAQRETPPPPPAGIAAAQTQPAASPWGPAPTGEVAATIDGRPLPLSRLTDLLIRTYGNDGLNQLVASEVVEQAGQKEGVAVTDEDVKKENAETVSELAGNVTASQQEQILTRILADKHMPRTYWDMTMRRNAILRQIALKRIKVTEPMIQEEFDRQYGQKVTVRHIQLSSTADAQKVLDLLSKGGDFAELAKKYSINSETAANGGLLPPFSRDAANIPPVLAGAAFELEDGQIGGILQVDRYFHIIRKESTEAAKGVRLEDVKSGLREQVLKNALHQMQMQLLGKYLSDVSLNIMQPELRKKPRASRSNPRTGPHAETACAAAARLAGAASMAASIAWCSSPSLQHRFEQQFIACPAPGAPGRIKPIQLPGQQHRRPRT